MEQWDGYGLTNETPHSKWKWAVFTASLRTKWGRLRSWIMSKLLPPIQPCLTRVEVVMKDIRKYFLTLPLMLPHRINCCSPQFNTTTHSEGLQTWVPFVQSLNVLRGYLMRTCCLHALRETYAINGILNIVTIAANEQSCHIYAKTWKSMKETVMIFACW